MKVPMVFENHEVEIFELNGKVLFNPRHVGECLDLTDSAVRMAIAEMNEKQVVKLTNESIVNTIDFRKLHNTGENFLTESGVYKLIFKSRKPEAEKFQDWVTDEVLPSIRKTGGYGAENDLLHFQKEVIAIKYAAEILNMSEVSKLGMMQRLFDSKGFDKASLPVYVEKKRLTFSATKLLEDRGKPMSAVAFNKLLVAEGILEEKTRKSTSSPTGYKTFKALSEKGLQYGENLVSPKNEKEVQPQYFEDTFDELLRIVTTEESE